MWINAETTKKIISQETNIWIEWREKKNYQKNNKAKDENQEIISNCWDIEVSCISKIGTMSVKEQYNNFKRNNMFEIPEN